MRYNWKEEQYRISRTAVKQIQKNEPDFTKQLKKKEKRGKIKTV